ncbi:GntR family transcriptional regulator [Herbiconiux solani]|uniref:GntR family transcriptional regulator n=1 Tax=Herbiconiux solani TaxID=661329 RepID=UPI0008243C14|nr:GntR family transcriptional regulator [Herbiconiux solani]
MSGTRDRLLELWRAAAESGTPLPSEAALAAELGVSRPTVREELIRLESAGLLTRLPNSGTFPNRSALEMGLRLDQSYEFSDMLREAGFEPGMEVLSSSWCELDAFRADRLGVRPGSPAFTTTKRWTANGIPTMVATDVIPAPAPKPGDPLPDASLTVFALVQELRGSTIEWELTWLESKVADADEQRMLGLAGAESVLGITMAGISVLGAKLYLAEETHRQGVVPYGLIRTVPHR